MLNIMRVALAQQSCIALLKEDRDTCFMLLSAVGYESEKVVDSYSGMMSQSDTPQKSLDRMH